MYLIHDVMTPDRLDKQSLTELQKELRRSGGKLSPDQQQQQQESPGVQYKRLIALIRPIARYAQQPGLSFNDQPLPLDTLTVVLSKTAKLSLKEEAGAAGADDEYLRETFKNDFVEIFVRSIESNFQPAVKAAKECLSGFMNAFPSIYGKGEKRSFAELLARRLLSKRGGKPRGKGEYNLLDSLVGKKWVTAGFILKEARDDSLFEVLLPEMSNRSLAPTLGKLIALLLSNYRNELLDSDQREKDVILSRWLENFVKPLAMAMSGDDLIRAHIELYVLPGTFKLKDQGFQNFVKSIPLHVAEDREMLSTVVACLRVGQSNGWITEEEGAHLLPPQYPLPELVAHPIAHIRLSALEMLVVTPRNSKLLPRSSIDCLKGCLDDYFAETDPDFRGKVYSTYRLLVDRLLASCYAVSVAISKLENLVAISKDPKQHDLASLEDLKTALEAQKSFVSWTFKELLPSQLRLGSSYQRTILALKIYSLWFTAPDIARKVHASNSKASGRDENVHFPFALEYDSPTLRRLLVEKVMDSFEDVRKIASSLLKQLPSSSELPWPSIFSRAGDILSTAGRAGEADGVSRFIEAIFGISLSRGNLIVTELWGQPLIWKGDAAQSVLDWAILTLEASLEKSKRGGISNAVYEDSKGVFGVLGGLRLIFERESLSMSLNSGGPSALPNLMLRLLEKCEDIWEITRGVLSIDSPTDGADDDGDDSGDLCEAPEAYNSGMGSRAVLSFSWRAVSEASALLEAMVKTLPHSSSEICGEFLTRCGRLLMNQLSTIRHRGSLMAVSPAFLAVCTRCLSNPSSEVSSLPAKWLDDEMGNIRVKSNLVTRRSAGLPMVISAVVNAEVAATKTHSERVILRGSFERLTKLAQDGAFSTAPKQNSKTEIETLVFVDGAIQDAPQVHAFNCLRQLFIDRRLSTSTDVFVPEALRISLSAFSSSLWAVRNCGIMLFTTLMLRIFGSGTGEAIYTIKSFFERFADVKELVFKVLQEAASGLESRKSINLEGVYPALSLISRLRRNDPADGIGETGERMRELVLQFLSCHFWKIRDAAAKAFVPLVENTEDSMAWIEVFLDWTSPGDICKPNIVHGGLSAARQLIEQELRMALAADVKAACSNRIAEIIVSRLERFMTGERCASPVNKALYIRLVRDFVLQTPGRLGSTPSHIKTVLDAHDFRATSLLRDAGTPLFNNEIAKCFASVSPAESVKLLLGCGSEVGQTVAEFLCTTDAQIDLHPAIEDALWKKVEDKSETWEPYRVSVINLLSKTNSKFSLKNLGRSLELAELGNTVPLKEAALIYAGKWIGASHYDHLKRWQDVLEDFSNENQPHSTRLAVLRSLKHCFEHWEAKEPKGNLLPVYFTLHKLLNDDEDDIRDEAASITCTLLATWYPSEGSGDDRLTATVASRKLLAALCQHVELADEERKTLLKELLLKGILSIKSLDSPDIEVTQQLEAASEPNTLLFKFEKQNLYYDRCRNMDAFAGYLGSLGRGNVKLMEAVTSYTRAGVQKLLSLLEKHEASKTPGSYASDGYLGWSTSIDEELFIIGLRCAQAFFLGCTWVATCDESTSKKWEEIIELVQTFVHKGECEEVSLNELWLERFRIGLNVQ